MVKIGHFNPDDHPSRSNADPLPKAWYAMVLQSADLKATKRGDGQYLELDWEIDESRHPEFRGRHVWDRLNLWNPNQQAKSIANQRLAEICRALGISAQDLDTDDLLGGRVAVRVKVSPATNEYEASNDVMRYDSISSRFPPGAPPAQSAPAPQTAAPSAPSAPPSTPPPAGQPGQVARPPWSGSSSSQVADS